MDISPEQCRALDRLATLLDYDPLTKRVFTQMVGDVLGESVSDAGTRELLERAAVAAHNAQECKEIACDALTSIALRDLDNGLTVSLEELDARLSLAGDSSFDQGEADAALVQAVRQVADDMARHTLGYEDMQDSPVAHWERELRSALEAASS